LVDENPYDAKFFTSLPEEVAGIINRKNPLLNCSKLNPSAAITGFHICSIDRMFIKEILRHIDARNGSRSGRIVPSRTGGG